MFKEKPIQTKSYATFFSLFALIIFIYHVSIYFLYTSKVLDVAPPFYVGDLVRQCYQVDSIDLKQEQNKLQKLHFEASSYHGQKIDVLTIGDSFSNGGAAGLNPYYQDYIATQNNYNVLNIRALNLSDGNVPNTLLALEQSGVLDEIQPKIVLLSIGSRAFVRRFSNSLTWKKKINKKDIYDEMKKMHPRDLAAQQLKNVSIVNTANFKLPFYSLSYRFKPCIKSVCKFELQDSMFSVKADKTILIYKQTLKDLHMNTQENISKANDNLNHLATLLQAKGIKLYFMPAVSKYDLYYDYIRENKYPKDKLFSILESLDKKYTLINTKKILSPLLKSGEKDIFYADDTHWSYKASKEIFFKTSFQ